MSIDNQFIHNISANLDQFKKKNKGVYNFRCPYCGDSQKYKNKARGYFFTSKNDLVYKCHNCGVGRTLPNFLKDNAPDLHDEYIMERYKSGTTGKGSYVPKPKFKKPVFEKKFDLPKASENPIATKYLEKRKIDPSKFYFTKEFQKWTNTHKQTFDTIHRDESRVIIPLHDTEKNLIGFQGRSLGPNSVKYITVMLNEDAPKIYGLDKIDDKKPIYITEGPFDSTFVENSVAMCGSDLDIGSFGWSNHIWVFDNEPRNREIVKRISNTIDKGEQVIIWPTQIVEKDINDMALAGHDIMSLLESNTYSGLKAKVKFNTWKKV